MVDFLQFVTDVMFLLCRLCTVDKKPLGSRLLNIFCDSSAGELPGFHPEF